MRSYADAFGSIVDCRNLELRGTFYNLSRNQVNELANEFVQFVNKEFKDKCLIPWKKDNRVFREGSNLLEYGDRYAHVGFDGAVKGENVYNIKTKKAYERRVDYDMVYLLNQHAPSGSFDYQEYYNNHIAPCFEYIYGVYTVLADSNPYRKVLVDPERFITELYRLYDLDPRPVLGLFCPPDLVGFCNVKSDHWFDRTPDYYIGEIKLSISLYSLDDSINETAQIMQDFAEYLSKRYININLSIGIDPGYYYGYISLLEPNHSNEEQSLEIVSKYIYAKTVTWANLLSPHLVSRVDSLSIGSDAIICRRFDSGGMILKSAKPLMETTMQQLKILKNVLKPVLFPGEWRQYVTSRFRVYWEPVPILDGEIKIEGNQVVFGKTGSIDKSFVDYCLT